MKLLLIGVNAKYVHTNLAVRYLLGTVSDICDAAICEYSINDSLIAIERDILLQKPDVLAFSCYIWNIGFVLELCSDLKKANHDIRIIVGGPEVSYDTSALLMNENDIDFAIKGEGEKTFPALIRHLAFNHPLPSEGITYRNTAGDVVDTCAAVLPDFDDIKFPYDDSIEDLNGKIIYYESSRGCPYSCKYCLSGDNSKVRFKDLDLVKKDLSFFDSHNVPLVKFVDRTFNANYRRANEIWCHISALPGNTRFHMEITGELLNDETIDVLKTVRPDKLQFEIGVQSTNPDTLYAINRRCDKDKLFTYISRLLSDTDIHVHLDLIVGLPYEDMNSFKNSFNDVLSLRPHVLQIGFLKVLKGSSMRNECERYGIKYRSKAPYEIISNDFMTCDDILYLKDLDFVFDKIYNSGSFSKTLDFLFKKFDTSFELFSAVIDYFRVKHLINKSFSKHALFDAVFDCFSEFGDDFEQCMRFDYIMAFSPGKLPAWANTDAGFRFSDEVYVFLRDEDAKKRYLPQYVDVPAKAAIKHVRFEKFGDKTIVFDYKNGSVCNVSDYYIKTKGEQ